MKRFIPLTLLLATAAFVGCSKQDDATSAGGGGTTDSASVGPINEHCPIMGEDVTEDGGQVDFNGQIVGFCCEECAGKFQALSDEEKTKALADADHAHGDHDHGDHDHGGHDHKDGDHDHKDGDHDHQEEAAKTDAS